VNAGILRSEDTELSNLVKGLILLLVVLGIGIGLVVWKNKVGTQAAGKFNSITKEEVELLIKDVGKQNPAALKRLGEDPEMRKQQLDNLKQLLAFASQAQREGLANEQPNRQELENIRAEVIAVNYDREINADKGPMPPFGFITEDRVKAFWGEVEEPNKGFFDNLKDKIGFGKRDNELAFNRFLDTKLAILKANNPQMADREVSDEERAQARDFFAKINIYEEEYQEKAAAGELSQEFQDKVNLQVKLQQAQFLARIYATEACRENKGDRRGCRKYIAENPQFNSSEKRAKAEEILARAKERRRFRRTGERV
jgi:hypothetical protein